MSAGIEEDAGIEATGNLGVQGQTGGSGQLDAGGSDVVYDVEVVEEVAGTGMMLEERRYSYDPALRHRRSLFVRNMVNLIPEPIKSSLKPPRTYRDWLEFLLMKIPILQWVWSYKFNYFMGDIIAGITVAIMHIPQGLAYALLANVAPIFGLYTSFIPVLVYSVMGSSRHVSVGTFAVVELMIGNSVDQTLLTFDELRNCSSLYNDSNVTEFLFQGELTTCDDVRTDVVVTIALLTGIIMFVMGLFQLGFITIFLSEPLISGYTTGAAVHVFTSQLQHITGLGETIKVAPGLFRIPRTWIAMFQNLVSINWVTIVISIVAIVFLILFRICNLLLKSPRVQFPFRVYRRAERRWIVKKFPWPVPIPSQLIVVIVATVISYFAMLEDKFGVIPIGNIPNGLPNITIPNARLMPLLIKDAFVISIVTFAVTVSLAKVFARDYGYKINSNQEFLALGMINLVGCFFSSFTAAGSLSRSSIQASAGGKTQLVGIISSAIILIVLIKLGSLFEPLPKAILAAIIWVALYGIFKQFKDLYKYSRLSWWDSVVWIAVFLATSLLGVDLGLFIGVGFSLLVIVLRIILPTSSVLGQAHESEDIFRNMDNFEKVDTIPGILIFRFQAPICFINCRVFRLRLEIACNVLNKAGMKLNRNTEGCLQRLCYKSNLTHHGGYGMASHDNVSASFNASTSTIAVQHSKADAISNDSNVNHLPSIEPIHTVVIDCSPIGFMDAVGVKTLQEIVVDFDKLGIQVLFVCMTKENRDLMGRSGFFRRCSKKWLFPSMQDAVRHAQYEPILHPVTSDYTTLGPPSSVLPKDEKRNFSPASSNVSLNELPDSSSDSESVGLVLSHDSMRHTGGLRLGETIQPSIAATSNKPPVPDGTSDNSKDV